ncbi:MAG: YdeI/OmpD-associated family protein [Bacteroidota bacterium]
MKPVSFKTHIDKLSYLKTFYLEIPESVVKKIGGIGKQRLFCEVNKTIKFQCGLIALGEGKAYVSINSKRMKEVGVGFGDIVNVTLSEDNSEYGVEIPEELAELFRQDPEGKKRFDLLTPGKQRYILNYVATVKSPQLRIDRAFLLISNLKTLPLGKEHFRDMLGK